ncbi:MAG: hypothetical protein HXX11_00650 [Desulfuromonadales bacterium]|nr:hypothetical protein [Desulfuromonadales bacterium]
MSLAIVDAREWQNMFDLRTGAKVDAVGPRVEMMRAVLKKFPYPGDMDPGSNRWVSDIALDLIGTYHPRFVFLNYAQQYFSIRYSAMDEAEQKRTISDLFAEVERFVRLSGFTPLVVGRGGMTPLLDFIDLSKLDGLAIATHWSVMYAGLHGPSEADLRTLADHPHIRMVVERKEMLRLFEGSPDEALRLPEYLLVAKKGYAFKTVSSVMRRPTMIHEADDYIPLHTPLGAVNDITAIRSLIEDNLKDHRIALIFLEGVGTNDFLLPLAPCRNGKEWYCHEPGAGQYLTITSGRHRVFDYPSGYKSYSETVGEKEYPLSGYFTSLPSDTIGEAIPDRSIAVGNNSMFMHTVTGADLCVECFARNLSNQGALGVIHRQGK